MDAALPLIDLDALVQPVARVRIRGTTYDVRPVTGYAYDLAAKINAKDRAAVTVQESRDYTAKIVGELVPEMDAVTITRLSPKQIGAIIDAASGGVRQIEQRIQADDRKNVKRSARRAKTGT